jgi:hypothetical protein
MNQMDIDSIYQHQSSSQLQSQIQIQGAPRRAQCFDVSAGTSSDANALNDVIRELGLEKRLSARRANLKD